jgi:hypothetical protein
MTASTFKRIRIPIAAALVAVAIAGLIEHHDQSRLALFLFLATGALMFLIPLMWIKSYWEHGVSILEVAFGSLLGCGMLLGWIEGDCSNILRAAEWLAKAAIGCAMIILLYLAPLVRKMIRPLDETQRRANLETLKPEDIRFLHVLGNALGLVVSFVGSALLWRDPKSTRWAILLLLPMSWFAWRVIWYLFVKSCSRSRGTNPVGTANQGILP